MILSNKQTIRLKKLPAVLLLALVLGLSHSLAQITWVLLEKPSHEIVRENNRVPETHSEQSVSERFGRELASWDLFGALTMETNAPINAASVQAPDTSLQLTLEGVYVASEAQNSSAIIADKGNAKRYHIGEEVQQGVTLHQVNNTFVILQRGSRYETLRFSDVSLQQVPLSNGRGASTQSSARTVNTNKGIVNGIRSGQIKSVQDVLEDYGANPAEQFQALLLESGMEATQEGGEPGFKVAANAPGDILKTAGLMPGDILRSVNDHPVNELQGNDVLVREILTSGRAKIVIQRGARRFAVSYPLPQH